MKFTDISKFTRAPPWHHNPDLTFVKQWIDEEVEFHNLQLNPDFQRGHVWTEVQQIAYVEYLLRGGSSGKDIYFNHPKWNSGRDSNEYVCVDGLQRITAVLKFLNNELPVFGIFLSEFEDRLRMADVQLSIWVNDLKTKEEVLTWYIEMNEGGTPHTKNEIDRVKKMREEL